MKVFVGTMNAGKITAVREVFAAYPHLAEAEVSGAEIKSEVSAQPRTMEETIRGAIARAKNAWFYSAGTTYGIGLESGIVEVPYTKTGFMDTCACAIYDPTPRANAEHADYVHLGLASFWEPPRDVVDLMLKSNIEMTDAFLRLGLSDDPKFGTKEGALGVLSKGRVTRIDHCKQALQAALIHLEPR